MNVKFVAWTSEKIWKRSTVGRSARRSCMRTRAGVKRGRKRDSDNTSSKYHMQPRGAATRRYSDPRERRTKRKSRCKKELFAVQEVQAL